MARSKHLPLYPANLDLYGWPVLVVGGGEVAWRKAEMLLECGAKVTMVAPELSPRPPAMKVKSAKVLRRRFRLSDLKSMRMVFAATDDAELNRRIAEEGCKRGLLVNVASPPWAGNFQVPATVRRGPLCIAFSTGGASCALARSLRQLFERHIGAEWGQLAELLESRRPTVLAQVTNPAVRRKLLQALGSAAWARRVKQLGPEAAAREMDACIASSANGAAEGKIRGGLRSHRAAFGGERKR
ncbi:MAG TPA: bifunctional precorrin-2 dehydrogenase/sirohydrochlorin ferrochelatase [Planctomycetota bacterium]